MTILRWILEVYDWRGWTIFIWLRIDTSGGLLQTLGFHKMLGNSSVAEQLPASPDGLASMEFVSQFSKLVF
jgi:hypothetical protein